MDVKNINICDLMQNIEIKKKRNDWETRGGKWW